jgi:hypothetical protein
MSWMLKWMDSLHAKKTTLENLMNYVYIVRVDILN